VGGGGGRWARAYASKWQVECRKKIIGYLVADIKQKSHKKYLANCMSPCKHLPLILVKPGPSQGQIAPFQLVTALRKNFF